jgi:hypothetical protein
MITENVTLAGLLAQLLPKSKRMLDFLSPLVDGKSFTTNSFGSIYSWLKRCSKRFATTSVH